MKHSHGNSLPVAGAVVAAVLALALLMTSPQTPRLELPPQAEQNPAVLNQPSRF